MDRQNEEIRKALERLGRTFERVADRMRALQRERKLLSERVEELDGFHHEQTETIARQEDLLEAARKRIAELEAGSSQSQQLEVGLETLKEELSREQQRAEERAAEWERRIAEAEKERDQTRLEAESLLQERDQARATVESMLVRMRQLEQGDDEQMTALRERVETLTSDLEEAFEIASSKESEVEELRARIRSLEAEVATVNGGVAISSDERDVLVDQVQTALELLDRHLGGDES